MDTEIVADSTLNRQNIGVLSPPHHRRDIEGLRAIAVIIVVCFHSHVPGFSGGFVGVDVFFVLSGYLITWLLASEGEQRGTIDLKRFYARRARRLLPALALVLVTTLFCTAFLYAPFEQRALARTWATTALYVSNIDFVRRGLDYHGAAAEMNPLLHTWSLSVEEQFYLIWPWLVLLGLGMVVSGTRRRPNPRRLVTVLGLATAISFALSLWLTRVQGGWAFYLAPTRAWEFGAGGLAVLLPGLPRIERLEPNARARLNELLYWVGAAALGIATFAFDGETPFPGVAALLPVLGTVALLRAGESGKGTLHRILGLRPMQIVGNLSYSLYLWHWPALVFAAMIVEPVSPRIRAAAIIVSLLIAYFSFRIIENPLRHSQFLSSTPWRSIGMAAVISGASVLLTVGWWLATVSWAAEPEQARLTTVARELPRIYGDGCDNFGTAKLTPCSYGDVNAAKTIVLVGDSHAGQYFPAVENVAKMKKWRLVVMTLSGCPFVDLPPLFNRTLRRSYPECVDWRARALNEIARIHPEVTIVASANGYEVMPSDWEQGSRRMLSVLKPLTHRTVLLLDPVLPLVDVPACEARAAWRLGAAFDPVCTRKLTVPFFRERVEAQDRAARSLGATSVSVAAEMERLGPPPDLPAYRDSSHISVQEARRLSPLFTRFIE